jgi:hypothetical protein
METALVCCLVDKVCLKIRRVVEIGEQGKLELKPQTFTSSDAIIQSLAWRVHYTALFRSLKPYR